MRQDATANLDYAFTQAASIGVPRLLDPEDVTDLVVPDRRSIVLYLMELHKCLQ